MYIWELKMVLRRAPGDQLILAHFACQTLLRFIGKISGKIFGPPDQILDPLLCPPRLWAPWWSLLGSTACSTASNSVLGAKFGSADLTDAQLTPQLGISIPDEHSSPGVKGAGTWTCHPWLHPGGSEAATRSWLWPSLCVQKTRLSLVRHSFDSDCRKGISYKRSAHAKNLAQWGSYATQKKLPGYFTKINCISLLQLRIKYFSSIPECWHKYVDQKELHRRWIWGESQTRKHVSEKSTLVTNVDVTRSPKKGNQWPHKKKLKSSKTFF